VKAAGLRLEARVLQRDRPLEWVGELIGEQKVIAPIDEMSYGEIKSSTEFYLEDGKPWPSLDKMRFAPAQVITTLEMKMKCGLGKCGWCEIGNAYVCKHGPVFSYAQLKVLPDEY
jgi:hypothetical protein